MTDGKPWRSRLACLSLVLIAWLDFAAARPEASDVPLGPGDDRRGYDGPHYVTNSRSLSANPAGSASLLENALTPPLGLPPLAVPDNSGLSPAGIELGRRLFFDRRLSGNGTMSCAMCHVPEQGFAHNEMRTALGIEGRSGRRNAPTILNVAYQPRLFHDGRSDSLESQVLFPLLAADEMGNRSLEELLAKLSAIDEYVGLFGAAFGGTIDEDTLGRALAGYQRTLLAADSPFDRWRYGGESEALDARARRGFDLFVGRAGCGGCHLVGDEWALFTDHQFHNTGIGYAQAQRSQADTARIQVAPGQSIVASMRGVEHPAVTGLPDLGRFEVTADEADRWRYRTPGLRNVALTAPYMHDGSLSTLADVVRFYDEGGVANPGLDDRIAPLGLDQREQADLVAFLDSLTGGNVRVLVADALAAPVGN